MENSKVFFYFIFKIFPKMQHFYAHFPPFYTNFVSKKENLLPVFLFLYFYSVFSLVLSLRMGCLPTG